MTLKLLREDRFAVRYGTESQGEWLEMDKETIENYNNDR